MGEWKTTENLERSIPGLEGLIERAIEEDVGFRDWTTDMLVAAGHESQALIRAQAQGVVCGVGIACQVFERFDPDVRFVRVRQDGETVAVDEPILQIAGKTRVLLSGERTALNFLQHLSGIATLTRQFVEAIAGTNARIVDTRKTTPGLRALEKYAVRTGGGFNHRFGLFDGILIKDNHLAALGGDLEKAVRLALQGAPHTLRIEVECATLDQVKAAIRAGVDAILLDNLSLKELREAVVLAKGKVQWLEASGGVNLQTVRAIAETGVDLISVGALTHSSPILTMHMEIEDS